MVMPNDDRPPNITELLSLSGKLLTVVSWQKLTRSVVTEFGQRVVKTFWGPVFDPIDMVGENIGMTYSHIYSTSDQDATPTLATEAEKLDAKLDSVMVQKAAILGSLETQALTSGIIGAGDIDTHSGLRSVFRNALQNWERTGEIANITDQLAKVKGYVPNDTRLGLLNADEKNPYVQRLRLLQDEMVNYVSSQEQVDQTKLRDMTVSMAPVVAGINVQAGRKLWGDVVGIPFEQYHQNIAFIGKGEKALERLPVAANQAYSVLSGQIEEPMAGRDYQLISVEPLLNPPKLNVASFASRFTPETLPGEAPPELFNMPGVADMSDAQRARTGASALSRMLSAQNEETKRRAEEWKKLVTRVRQNQRDVNYQPQRMASI